MNDFLKFAQFVKKQIRSPLFKQCSLAEQRMILKGFSPENVRLLGLNQSNWKHYLTDFEKKRISTHTNIGFSQVLTNKLEFHAYFKDLFDMPTLVGVVNNGSLRVENEHSISSDLLSILRKFRSTVFRPVFGGGSIGVRFVELRGSEIWLDGERSSETVVEQVLGRMDGYMINQGLTQSQYADSLYPHSFNTIRVLTIRNVETGELEIPLAAQRIGTAQSMPTDNCSAGGLGADVNVTTGSLGTAVYRDGRYRSEFFENHMDTGSRIAGTQIEGWEQLCDMLTSALSKHPHFDYVGWDILPSGDKFYVIEGNHNPGTYIFQPHTPLLSNNKVRAFLRAKGVVRR